MNGNTSNTMPSSGNKQSIFAASASAANPVNRLTVKRESPPVGIEDEVKHLTDDEEEQGIDASDWYESPHNLMDPLNDVTHMMTADNGSGIVASQTTQKRKRNAIKKRQRIVGQAWTEEEKSILLEGLKNGLSYKQIHEESLLPKRTLVAIRLQASSLKKTDNDFNAQLVQPQTSVDPSKKVPQVLTLDYSGGIVVSDAIQKRKKRQARQAWSEEEKSKMLEGLRKGLSCKQIHDESLLPNRTLVAIRLQATSLKKHEDDFKIQPVQPRSNPVGPSKNVPQGPKRDSGGRAVTSRASKKRKRQAGKAWTAEEKSIMMEGLRNGLSYKQIHEKSLLPNRTLVAIMLRATSWKKDNHGLNVQPDQLHEPMVPSNDVPQEITTDSVGVVTSVEV